MRFQFKWLGRSLAVAFAALGLVHAALAPADLAEGSPLAVAFITAGFALAALAAALVATPSSLSALRARRVLQPQPRDAVGGPERRP